VPAVQFHPHAPLVISFATLAESPQPQAGSDRGFRVNLVCQPILPVYHPTPVRLTAITFFVGRNDGDCGPLLLHYSIQPRFSRAGGQSAFGNCTVSGFAAHSSSISAGKSMQDARWSNTMFS